MNSYSRHLDFVLRRLERLDEEHEWTRRDIADLRQLEDALHEDVWGQHPYDVGTVPPVPKIDPSVRSRIQEFCSNN